MATYIENENHAVVGYIDGNRIEDQSHAVFGYINGNSIENRNHGVAAYINGNQIQDSNHATVGYINGNQIENQNHSVIGYINGTATDVQKGAGGVFLWALWAANSDAVNSSSNSASGEKPNLLIRYILLLAKNWGGRIGMILGVILLIVMLATGQAHDPLNAIFIGVFGILILGTIGGIIGAIINFIRKLVGSGHVKASLIGSWEENVGGGDYDYDGGDYVKLDLDNRNFHMFARDEPEGHRGTYLIKDKLIIFKIPGEPDTGYIFSIDGNILTLTRPDGTLHLIKK